MSSMLTPRLLRRNRELVEELLGALGIEAELLCRRAELSGVRTRLEQGVTDAAGLVCREAQVPIGPL